MQINRILFIINQLSLGPETISSLHSKLGQKGYAVSQRTVYRDLVKLEETFRLGKIKLRRYTGEFNKATWLIVSEEPSAPSRKDLYFQTFLTEHFKPEWMKSFTGDSIEDVFSSGNGINAKDAHTIQKSVSQFSILNSNWGEFIYNQEHYERLKDFVWAISNQRILYITFYDHTAEIEQRFRPLRIILHRGTIHIAGWAFKGDSMVLQVQELDSVRTIRITNERFTKQGEDDMLSRKLSDCFGIHDYNSDEKHRVVLQMKEGPAIFLRNRKWHPTQLFRKEGDYWYMEFTCTINIELIGWIFSWLEHVKVVAPDFLGELIAKRADYISSMYRRGFPVVAPANTDNPFEVGK